MCSAVQSASLIRVAIAGVTCEVLLIPTRPVEGAMLVNGPYFKLRHYLNLWVPRRIFASIFRMRHAAHGHRPR